MIKSMHHTWYIILRWRSPHWLSKTKSSLCDVVSFDRYMAKTRTSLPFWIHFPKHLINQSMDSTENVTKLSRIWSMFKEKKEKRQHAQTQQEEKNDTDKPSASKIRRISDAESSRILFPADTCIICDKKPKRLRGCTRYKKNLWSV